MIDRPSPSVSCLMLSHSVPGRLPYAKRSIADFCRQTLSNKNLVLIPNGGVESVKQELCDHVESLSRRDIHIFNPPGGLNVGALRNFSLEVAPGDILCNWDDDDLYHPQRLEKQLAVLLEGNFEAVYLQEIMQYFARSKKLYWTNWIKNDVPGHAGTLMVRREVPIQYPTEGIWAHPKEDTAVAHALMARGRVGYVAGQPHLHVYVSHGANAWHDGFHQMLADELAISEGLLRRREAFLREGMAPYGFAPDSVAVMGNNGQAFML